jgi:hypothetical protein
LSDIADVYVDHVVGTDDFNGDIGYNFLICRHGNIYQGRGYERGEANAGDVDTIDGLGRNAGFSSICARRWHYEIAPLDTGEGGGVTGHTSERTSGPATSPTTCRAPPSHCTPPRTP